MRKITLLTLLSFSFVLFAQNSEVKSFEKFQLKAGFESSTYLGFGASTQGYKIELDVPIYQRLGATFAYSKHSPYIDYCDDIPVNATTQFITAGLNYTILEKSRWLIAVLAGVDAERVRYKELGSGSFENVGLHNERVHSEEEDNHSEVGLFVEGFVGVNVGYSISDRLQLNLSSRLNTFGSFRNSVSLGYKFGMPKKEKVRYFYK